MSRRTAKRQSFYLRVRKARSQQTARKWLTGLQRVVDRSIMGANLMPDQRALWSKALASAARP